MIRSGTAATGEARKDDAKRRGVNRSAVRTGSRSLRASTGVARIRSSTASASGVKGALRSPARARVRERMASFPPRLACHLEKVMSNTHPADARCQGCAVCALRVISEMSPVSLTPVHRTRRWPSRVAEVFVYVQSIISRLRNRSNALRCTFDGANRIQ